MERHMPRGDVTETDVRRMRWLVVEDEDGNEMARTNISQVRLQEGDFLDLEWHLQVVSDGSSRASEPQGGSQ